MQARLSSVKLHFFMFLTIKLKVKGLLHWNK